MYSTFTKQHVMAYVAAYGKDIIDAITDTGLYFPAFVGQTYVESRSGKVAGELSDLASKYNNFGGIKYSPNIPFVSGSVDSTTGEGSRDAGTYQTVQDSFAVFATPLDSFKSHVAILKHDIYVHAGVFSAPSPEEQILRIAQAGYTTASPQEYLRLISSALECTRDVYKLGLITSNAPSGIGNNGAQGQWPSAQNGWDFLSFIKQTTTQQMANTMEKLGINK